MTAYMVKITPPGTTLAPGTVFQGEDDTGGDIKRTDVDPPVIIPFGFADPVEGDVPPIAGTDDKTRFCTDATVFARQEKTDRDYLLAVAYYSSANLGKFGQATDDRIGPFKFTIKDWIAATASFNVPAVQYPVTDVFQWKRQIAPAARRAAEQTKAFKDANNGGRPDSVQLYFYERVGAGAADFLKLAKDKPNTKFKDITPAPAAGSFLAEIAKSQPDKEVSAFVQEVTDGLMAGFGASRNDVARLPVHLRYFNDEDWAPWLAVARMMKGDSLQTSTDKSTALFMSTITDGTPPPATFVAFCMIFCGDAVVKAKLPANNMQKPATWENWADKAPDPAPAGAVVITDATVPQGIGILAEAATADPVHVWICSKDDAGAVKVELKPVAKAAITKWRWLDLSTATTAAGTASTRVPGANDKLFADKAPGIMTKLMTDFALSDVQAAAILGNVGHECMGFQAMQEMKPTGQDGRGGLGWAQWTDGRRHSFEAFAKDHGGVLSDEANYGYLKKELSGAPYNKAIDQLHSLSDLLQAVKTFEQIFEVADPATVNYDSRLRYAEIALGLQRKKLDPPIA